MHNIFSSNISALATATLIDYGLITKEDSTNVISRMKVRRARHNYRKNLNLSNDNTLTAVYFDGRKDNTLNKYFDESNIIRYKTIKEEHYVLTSEPDGTYITHFTTNSSNAHDISEGIVNYLQTSGNEQTIQVIGSDSTNTMSGYIGGVHHFIEIILNRNLFRVFCALHINELPLRHLFINLDGKTSGHDSFSGTIGKTLKNLESYRLQESFMPIIDDDSLPSLSDEVLSDLSWDQQCLYKLLIAVKTGKYNSDIAHLKIGPINHSRWLTLACRILYLYMCKHNLSSSDEQKLYNIAHFISTNYGPLWFMIKQKPSIKYAPKHYFQQLQLLKLLPTEISDIVKPYVERNAYYCHPENLLLSMICDDDKLIRLKAITTISEIRKNSDRSVRLFRTPTLNFNADSYHEMIDWNKEKLTEPPLTYNLTNNEICQLEHQAFTIPPYSAHTQSVERAIKIVTEASTKVYGFEKRDGLIKSKLSSRKLYSKSDAKSDLKKML